MGTGNSLFKRSKCFNENHTFDVRYNNIGGEDVAFIRSLVERGITLRWCPDARVVEHVPASRMSYAYMRRKRFQDGMIRCLVEAQARRYRWIKVGFWMGVGLLQFIAFGLGAEVAALTGSRQADGLRVRRESGRGKLLWWRAGAIDSVRQ